MPTTIAPTNHATLLKLINGTYSDKVERILSAQIQDDGTTVVAIAQDGKKQIAAQIDGEKIKIKLLNPEVVKEGADFAEYEIETQDAYTDQLRTKAAPEFEEWVGQVQKLLEESGDLSDFSENLLDLYPELNGVKLHTIMVDAMTAASLAGSLEE
jgi:phage gp29-like protein